MLTCDSLFLLWPKGLNLLKPQRFRPIIFDVKYSLFLGVLFFLGKIFSQLNKFEIQFP